MDTREIRLRLIEIAAQRQQVHQDGYAAGVIETAQRWLDWVHAIPATAPPADPRKTLGLPNKK